MPEQARIRHDPLCPVSELGGWGVCRCELIERVMERDRQVFVAALMNEINGVLHGNEAQADIAR